MESTVELVWLTAQAGSAPKFWADTKVAAAARVKIVVFMMID